MTKRAPKPSERAALDQQQRIVAAGAALLLDRLDRRLRALLLAHAICERAADRGVHGGEQVERVGRRLEDELPRPFVDHAARIRIVALAQAAEIGAVVGRMHERIGLRLGRDRKVEPRQRIALDGERRRDGELGRRLVEIDQRDRIAEHVVQPAHLAGRRDAQARRRPGADHGCRAGAASAGAGRR